MQQCIAAPATQKPIHNYAVMISEEDGDIDIDLPRENYTFPYCPYMYMYMYALFMDHHLPAALEREDHLAKFRFKYLWIVKVSSIVVW